MQEEGQRDTEPEEDEALQETDQEDTASKEDVAL